MVNVSVVMSVSENNFEDSVDSIRNQGLNDIEIICIDDNDIVDVNDENVRIIKPDDDIDEINGKYLYFLNPGDILKADCLKRAFDLAESENLDFVQITDDDTFTGEIHQFTELKGKTFQMDMTRYTKLFRTDFIRNLSDIAENDYLFFWEAIFNARRFAFVNVNQQFNSIKKTYKDLADLIGVSNEVFAKFKEYDYIGKFKFVLFDWRMELLHDAYVNAEDKKDYYELLRDDFTQMIYHWRFTDFSVYVSPINKLFFNDIVYSKDYDDFKRLMVQYDIELDSEKIKKENEIIEKNISILSRENNLITSSTSWKVTKPLRGLK